MNYRQLHSKRLSYQHPLRVIAHCDVDAAYAQFEQVRLNIPPDKPLAVQQWSSLIAVNYPAREFGITRHLAFDEAKKKCPDLICVHVATYAQSDSESEAKYHENPRPETHKVSLDPYRRESVTILKLFSESCPTIEKASIDEAFLDLSIPVRDSICSRFQLPKLQSLRSLNISLDDPVPLPPPESIEQLFKEAKSNIIPIVSHPSEHPTTPTWTDIALLIGADLMAQCRQKVLDQLGYTCSAGIATNKMLAKLCSAYKKPNAQTILRPAATRDFLRPYGISKIRFLGGKLGQSVMDLLSSINHISTTSESNPWTLGDVWKISLNDLQNQLGEETGTWVWETVRGVDRSEVESKTQVKSMMSSKNFRPSINTWDQGIHWLRILARDLFARLNEARQVTPGIWPKSIVMHKRDGAYNSFAKQIAFPFTSQLSDQYIFLLAQKLLQEFSTKRSTDQAFQIGTITSLGLAFQSLERIEPGQRGIQSFFRVPQQSSKDLGLSSSKRPEANGPPDLGPSKRPLVDSAVSVDSSAPHPHLDQSDALDPIDPEPDRTRSKSSSTFEDESGLMKPSKKQRMEGSDAPLSIDSNVNPDSKASPRVPSEPTGTHRKSLSLLTFVCPRCHEVISFDEPDHGDYSYDEDGSNDLRQARFDRLKTLHLDEHFARDLWEVEEERSRAAAAAESSLRSDRSPLAHAGQTQSIDSSESTKSGLSSDRSRLVESVGGSKKKKKPKPSSSDQRSSSSSSSSGQVKTKTAPRRGLIEDFFKPVVDRS